MYLCLKATTASFDCGSELGLGEEGIEKAVDMKSTQAVFQNHVLKNIGVSSPQMIQSRT